MAKPDPPFATSSEHDQRRAREFGAGIHRVRAGRAAPPLAARAGITAKRWYEIERGETLPRYEEALAMTRVLNVTLADIHGDEWTQGETNVARKQYALDWGVVVPHGHGALSSAPTELRLNADGYEPPRRHDGTEWVFVVSGAVQLRVGHRSEGWPLYARQFTEFDASQPHTLRGLNGEPAVILRGMSVLGKIVHRLNEEDLRRGERQAGVSLSDERTRVDDVLGVWLTDRDPDDWAVYR
jgi:DNA-binding XRE family transcriptional regulator